MSAINLFISSIMQVIFFTIIPLIWWLTFWRKNGPFFKWLGLKKIIIDNKTRFAAILIVAIINLSLQVLIIPYIVDIEILAAYQFFETGIKALVPALIYSFIQTGLSEEIFFRGFLAKRLIRKLGFQTGNAIQSLLFGLLHGIMLKTNMSGTIILVLSTSITAWLMGWLNEKEANGSILPGWLLHGILNYVSAIFMMFNLY